MLSLDKIRTDLKEIRYYYSRKESFDEAFKLDPFYSDILDKIRKYGDAMKPAPIKLSDLYFNLYIKNHTQESFSAVLGYVPEYIQKQHKQLLLFLQERLSK